MDGASSEHLHLPRTRTPQALDYSGEANCRDGGEVGCGSAHVLGYRRSSPGELPTPVLQHDGVSYTSRNNLKSRRSKSHP